jgi:hypothetical protein
VKEAKTECVITINGVQMRKVPTAVDGCKMVPAGLVVVEEEEVADREEELLARSATNRTNLLTWKDSRSR